MRRAPIESGRVFCYPVRTDQRARPCSSMDRIQPSEGWDGSSNLPKGIYKKYGAEIARMKKRDTSAMKRKIRNNQIWRHPGGKLRELGADKLSDAELLAILISIGTKNKSAEQIAEDLIAKYGSFRGLANQPLRALCDIKGLGDVKVIRIAAAFEIARRIADELSQEHAER